MSLETIASAAAPGGRQLVCRHQSAATGTAVIFTVFLPPQADLERCPVLSGRCASVSTVGYALGFGDPAQLSRHYRARFGRPPSKPRRAVSPPPSTR